MRRKLEYDEMKVGVLVEVKKTSSLFPVGEIYQVATKENVFSGVSWGTAYRLKSLATGRIFTRPWALSSIREHFHKPLPKPVSENAKR